MIWDWRDFFFSDIKIAKQKNIGLQQDNKDN